MLNGDCASSSVFDLQRFSIHDGPGIRTTVFFAGCPLRCAWCQNPEAFEGHNAVLMSTKEIVLEVKKDHEFFAVSGGGITLSGGEPLLHLSNALKVLQESKREGLHTCVQTSGAVPPDHLKKVAPWVDLFQFDLKHMSPYRHRELTGAGNKRILLNARLLVSLEVDIQFRMPVIPGINDDLTNLEATARFLKDLGVPSLQLVPYHRLYLDKYKKLGLTPSLPEIKPSSEKRLGEIVHLLQLLAIHAEVVH